MNPFYLVNFVATDLAIAQAITAQLQANRFSTGCGHLFHMDSPPFGYHLAAEAPENRKHQTNFNAPKKGMGLRPHLRSKRDQTTVDTHRRGFPQQARNSTADQVPINDQPNPMLGQLYKGISSHTWCLTTERIDLFTLAHSSRLHLPSNYNNQ